VATPRRSPGVRVHGARHAREENAEGVGQSHVGRARRLTQVENAGAVIGVDEVAVGVCGVFCQVIGVEVYNYSSDAYAWHTVLKCDEWRDKIPSAPASATSRDPIGEKSVKRRVEYRNCKY
jgi:hypothetical protein